MEVDMHSPSFRELRSYSTKRCRSPDASPSPLERRSKRMSLAVDSELAPSPTIPHNILPISASTSRFPSEDWVKQADSLTIDGPLLPGVQPAVAQDAHHTNMQETTHDVMTMDSDESIRTYRPQLSIQRSTHGQAPHIQITTSSTVHHSPLQYCHPYNQLQSSLLSAAQPYAYLVHPQTELLIPQGQMPMICVLPATPSDSPISRQDQDTHPQVPLPTSGPTSSPSSAINRKQRFTMGPRSDCEKCRLGVKGHWMHFE